MKTSAIQWIVCTTLVLIMVAIFATMDLHFNWVFCLTVVGQIMLVFTVYRILKDDYKTDKTFEDFYEDRPDLGE